MRLFVYGTLKRGYNNFRFLRDAEFVREDEAPGILYAGYGAPIVQPPKEGEQDEWVKGEVYNVDKETMQRCDGLEGHPRGYTRTLVTLKSGVDAFIYYWNHDIPRRYRQPSGSKWGAA